MMSWKQYFVFGISFTFLEIQGRICIIHHVAMVSFREYLDSQSRACVRIGVAEELLNFCVTVAVKRVCCLWKW